MGEPDWNKVLISGQPRSGRSRLIAEVCRDPSLLFGSGGVVQVSHKYFTTRLSLREVDPDADFDSEQAVGSLAVVRGVIHVVDFRESPERWAGLLTAPHFLFNAVVVNLRFCSENAIASVVDGWHSWCISRGIECIIWPQSSASGGFDLIPAGVERRGLLAKDTEPVGSARVLELLWMTNWQTPALRSAPLAADVVSSSASFDGLRMKQRRPRRAISPSPPPPNCMLVFTDDAKETMQMLCGPCGLRQETAPSTVDRIGASRAIASVETKYYRSRIAIDIRETAVANSSMRQLLAADMLGTPHQLVLVHLSGQAKNMQGDVERILDLLAAAPMLDRDVVLLLCSDAESAPTACKTIVEILAREAGAEVIWYYAGDNGQHVDPIAGANGLGRVREVIHCTSWAAVETKGPCAYKPVDPECDGTVVAEDASSAPELLTNAAIIIGFGCSEDEVSLFAASIADEHSPEQRESPPKSLMFKKPPLVDADATGYRMRLNNKYYSTELHVMSATVDVNSRVAVKEVASAASVFPAVVFLCNTECPLAVDALGRVISAMPIPNIGFEPSFFPSRDPSLVVAPQPHTAAAADSIPLAPLVSHQVEVLDQEGVEDQRARIRDIFCSVRWRHAETAPTNAPYVDNRDVDNRDIRNRAVQMGGELKKPHSCAPPPDMHFDPTLQKTVTMRSQKHADLASLFAQMRSVKHNEGGLGQEARRGRAADLAEQLAAALGDD